MRYTLLVFSILFNLLAPMPPGIAYNPETKECGYYMGGDEYGSYAMPSGWVINYGDPIQIGSSSHQWDGNVESIESFCEEMGYTYVSGNLGEKYGRLKSSPLFGIRMICKTIPFILLGVGILVGILIFTKWKKKQTKN